MPHRGSASRPRREPAGRRRALSREAALRTELEEARQALEAIRGGQVDALVIRAEDGERVYALETADRPYRVLVEQMDQGAATLSEDGLIVYSNPRLNALMDLASDALVGIPF